MKVFTLKPYNSITEPQYKKVIAFLEEISKGENVEKALAKITAAPFDPPSPIPAPKKTKKTDETIVLNSDQNDTVTKIRENIKKLIELSEKQLQKFMQISAAIENGTLRNLPVILESISTTFNSLNDETKLEIGTKVSKFNAGIIFQDDNDINHLKTVVRLSKTGQQQDKSYPFVQEDVMMNNKQLYYDNYYTFDRNEKGRIVRDRYLHFIESYILVALMILNAEHKKKVTTGLQWIKDIFTQGQPPTADMHQNFIQEAKKSISNSNKSLHMEICSALEMIEKNHVYIDAAGNYDTEAIETDLIEPLRELIGNDNQQLTELFGLYTKGSLQRLSAFDKDTQTRYLHCLSRVAGAITENYHNDQEFIDECNSQWPFSVFSLTEGQVLHV